MSVRYPEGLKEHFVEKKGLVYWMENRESILLNIHGDLRGKPRDLGGDHVGRDSPSTLRRRVQRLFRFAPIFQMQIPRRPFTRRELGRSILHAHMPRRRVRFAFI
jgi:hypothetical protein